MRYAGLLLMGILLYAQPANDNPCGAVLLTPSTGCTYTNGNLNGATATPSIPAPGCASYSGGDVWYYFPVPLGGSVLIQVNSSFDLGMAIYSATSCTGPFTLIECDDDDGPSLNPAICRTGGSYTSCSGQSVDSWITCNPTLTPGTTVWIRLWRYGNGTPGNVPFQICVIDCGSSGGGCGAASYTAYSCPCPTPAGGSWCGTGCTSAGVTTDDVYSSSWISIPFNFYFAGSTYNQLLVGANGLVVFPPSGFTPGSYDGWSWGGYVNDLYSIQFQQDIHPGLGGTICYRTIGTSPNRCFVIQYCNVPYFGSACTGLTFTGELRLCENGSIQVNISNKPTCSGWNSGGCYIGIVGASSGDRWAIHNAQPCPSLTNTCYAFTPPLSCQVSTPPAGCVPLAATIEAFTAQGQDAEIAVRWETAAEEGVHAYRLERSADLQRWEAIATVPAQGRATRYEVRDDRYPVGYSSVYYRLWVEEKMGSAEKLYGPIEAVINEKRPIRPVQSVLREGDALRIRLSTGEEVQATLYDATGKKVYEGRFSGPGEAEIPAVFFGRGFHILYLQVVGGEAAAYRILKL